MLYEGADPEFVDNLKKQYGLNKPLYEQYFLYLQNMLQLQAGHSLRFQQPVIDYVKWGVFNSFILIAPALTFSYIIAFFYGSLLGNRRGSFIEKFGIIPVVLAGSTPAFFISVFLVVIFSGGVFDWFPIAGMWEQSVARSYDSWWGPYTSSSFFIHYILPFTAIVLRYTNTPTLIMRTSVVEVKGQAFMTYHRLTGLSSLNRFRHLAKHASLPIITLYPISLVKSLGGLVLIEMVFNWPGIGLTLVDSVFARDYPVVMFIFFIMAAFIIISNFVVDLVYSVIDPRVVVGESG